jgi:hypothetical protein
MSNADRMGEPEGNRPRRDPEARSRRGQAVPVSVGREKSVRRVPAWAKMRNLKP